MSPEVFDQAVASTRMRPDSIEAARRVLVYGTTARQAAEAADRSHAWARQAVARVMRGARDVLLCPDSWEVVTVCLPPDDAWEVRELERLRRDAIEP